MTDTPPPTHPPIPEAVKNVVQRSIAVVKAFRELRRAGEEKASETARAGYRKKLQSALVELDAAVMVLPKIPSGSKGSSFDWSGFFRTAMRGIDLVRDIKDGKVGPREASRFVEAEVIEMKTPRR